MPTSFVYRRPGSGGPFTSELLHVDGEVTALVHRRLGEHRATYTFKERDGRPVLVGLEVTAVQPDADAELTSRALRELTRTSDVHEYVRRHIRQARQSVPAAILGYQGIDAVKEPRRDGRKGYPDSWYLRFAARYAELVEEGDHRPVVTMANELGESVKYVEDVIRRARKQRGLLTDSPRAGVAGGTLTPKAQALMTALQP